MSFIVSTNIIASWPHIRANIFNLYVVFLSSESSSSSRNPNYKKLAI